MTIMDLFDWRHITFANPAFFGLLIFLPLMIWWYFRTRSKAQASFKVSSLEGLNKMPVSWRVKYRPILMVLRSLAFVLLVIAVARPQSSSTTENVNSEGIDIVLCVDVSGSMLAQDFHPNRIEAAKNVALNFVQHRPTDRIGLVIFAGESFTQCPITTDHAVLENQIEAIKSGMLEDGTAIGMGLGTSVDRLKDSKAKSKVVILLTDGVNNTGMIDPLTALEIAKAYNVRVYTIGVGTEGMAPYPVQTPTGTQLQNMEVQIDEGLLKKIANETGGQYFRATDNKSLQNVYSQIDKMEKTKVEITSYRRYAELFWPFAMAALIFLGLEILLRYTVFRTLP